MSFPRRDRILVVAPHPDDESVATGGVLLRAASAGAPTRVLYLTDGENNAWAQRATEWRLRIGAPDRLRWGARRRSEAIDALRTLGHAPGVARFLGFPDQGITDHLLHSGPAVSRLADELLAFRPTTLYLPSLADRHPDHSATAILVQFALENVAHIIRPRVLAYTVHGPRTLRSKRLRWLSLTGPEQAVKRQAILCHASQLRLRRRFLVAFARTLEPFAPVLTAPERVMEHPLRLQRADSDTWCFGLRPPIGMALGRARLLLVSQGAGEQNVLSVDIPRRVGRAGVVWTADGKIAGRTTTQSRRAWLEITVTSPRLQRTELRLAKLELALDRKLGVFDRWPWLAFGVPATRPSRAVVEGGESRRSYAGI